MAGATMGILTKKKPRHRRGPLINQHTDFHSHCKHLRQPLLTEKLCNHHGHNQYNKSFCLSASNKHSPLWESKPRI